MSLVTCIVFGLAATLGVYWASRESLHALSPKSRAVLGLALAELLVLGRKSFVGFFSAAILLLLIFLSSTDAIVIQSLGLAGSCLLIATTAYFVVASARLEGSAARRELVFFNPIPAIGTSFERVIEEGLARDVSEPIVLYITEADWSEIAVLTPEKRQYFEGEFSIAPGLYSGRGTNDFLHGIDSLGLWPFVVHPGNEQAISAFATALKSQAAQLAPVAPVSIERPTPPKRTPPAPRPSATPVPPSDASPTPSAPAATPSAQPSPAFSNPPPRPATVPESSPAPKPVDPPTSVAPPPTGHVSDLDLPDEVDDEMATEVEALSGTARSGQTGSPPPGTLPPPAASSIANVETDLWEQDLDDPSGSDEVVDAPHETDAPPPKPTPKRELSRPSTRGLAKRKRAGTKKLPPPPVE